MSIIQTFYDNLATQYDKNDVRLEADYKNKKALLCDLTFWAVEFLCLVESVK